jgi:c-di-GMP-binding flagellar brake protein YcgR
MEKRDSRRRKTRTWDEVTAKALIHGSTFEYPVVDISIGGIGVLVSDGFSLLRPGAPVVIKTLAKKGEVIATDIPGRVAHLGAGVPSRVGIDFSPADTPIEAYARLNETAPDSGRIITDRDRIIGIFENVKKLSRGFGDMLMIHRSKAIPAEFFYLRPEQDNMVLRIVRISDLKLPFTPAIDMVYPFYLFKGSDVLLFTARVLDVIKNIVEVSWPDAVRHISRRNVLRYLVTGQTPLTATIVHPLDGRKVEALVWDISIEGMGAEILNDKTPLIEGMNLPVVLIHLPGRPVKTEGVVRSARTDKVLEQTQVGIEFTGGAGGYQDQILSFILESDLPSETVISSAGHSR